MRENCDDKDEELEAITAENEEEDKTIKELEVSVLL